jgi:hypothetical protein
LDLLKEGCMRRLYVALALLLLCPLPSFAQSIQPPSNPVVFCGTQAAPVASSYQLIFDGAAPVALTMDATVNAACPSGTTHSFSVVAAKFTVGNHTLVVRAINTFGSTDGPVYTVTVGIAPGPFEIKAVIGPGGE